MQAETQTLCQCMVVWTRNNTPKLMFWVLGTLLVVLFGKIMEPLGAGGFLEEVLTGAYNVTPLPVFFHCSVCGWRVWPFYFLTARQVSIPAIMSSLRLRHLRDARREQKKGTWWVRWRDHVCLIQKGPSGIFLQFWVYQLDGWRSCLLKWRGSGCGESIIGMFTLMCILSSRWKMVYEGLDILLRDLRSHSEILWNTCRIFQKAYTEAFSFHKLQRVMQSHDRVLRVPRRYFLGIRCLLVELPETSPIFSPITHCR